MKGLWRRLPWWGKALIILFLVAGIGLLFIFFWIPILVGLLVFLFLWVMAHSRPSRTVYYEDRDEGIYIPRRGTPPRSDIQRAADWHIPKVNKDGVNFIKGAPGLGKTQRDAMRRTKKNLWG